jgi:bifunctional enzyme CysN/CysC
MNDRAAGTLEMLRTLAGRFQRLAEILGRPQAAVAQADTRPADQFEARLFWAGEAPMMPGRNYPMRMHAEEALASVTQIKYREDPAGARLAARTLRRGDVAVVNLATSVPVGFAPYVVDPERGSFVLLDASGKEPIGAGVIDFALRRAANLRWQALDVSKALRAASLHQTPRCVWFTGLPASGKSTLANLLEARLHAEGRHTYLLDGDNVRHGLSRDLGFTEVDRIENIRRVAEVARLMVDAGLVVIVSFISPFHSERRMARELFGPGEFVEVFVDTPLEECIRRDPKGHYAKARRGELRNFTGIDSPYEPPRDPDVHVRTTQVSPEQAVRAIVEHLDRTLAV